MATYDAQLTNDSDRVVKEYVDLDLFFGKKSSNSDIQDLTNVLINANNGVNVSSDIPISEIVITSLPTQSEPEPDVDSGVQSLLSLRQVDNKTQYKLGSNGTALTGIKLFFQTSFTHSGQLNSGLLFASPAWSFIVNANEI